MKDAVAGQPGLVEGDRIEGGKGQIQYHFLDFGSTGAGDGQLNRNAALVAGKIRSLTGGSHVDVGVLTHHHVDHIGYVGYGGFWSLLEEESITFDKIIDRDAGTWVDGSGGGIIDGICDYEKEIVWTNAGHVSNTGRKWLCYATDPANTNIEPIREVANVGSTTQIDPTDPLATVTVIQADGYDVMMSDGTTPISGDHTGMSKPPSENDYSIALKISYGQVDYATAGDSDGEYASSSSYTYNDVETVIAPRFGQVELLRVNHHGSSHSTSQYYVDTLDPEASFISCGTDNRYGHPAQQVLDRLTATGRVYLTNDCNNTLDYKGAKIANGDILIRSENGITYEVILPTQNYLYLPAIIR